MASSTLEPTVPIVAGETDPTLLSAAAWSRVFNRRRDACDLSPNAVVNATSPVTNSSELRTPFAVARPRNTREIAEAARFAAQHNKRVAVRSGGHSWAAWSVRRDAVVIDLGDCKEIEYDEETQIVKCHTRVSGRILNGFLATKGRFFPGGHCPDVGLGGFLLQGGMGWVCRSWGWACENILGIDVVTVDGQTLHCSEKENQDLFFACRGAGPGFPAIITRFHLRTLPLLDIYKNVYIYPVSFYTQVLQWVVDIAPTVDRDTEVVCLAIYPAESDEPKILAAFTSFKRTKAEAEAALRPVHDSRPAGAEVDDFCKLTTLAKEYEHQAVANPGMHRYCAENSYVRNGADVPAVLSRAFLEMPSKKSFALYFAMAPTSRRHDPMLSPPNKDAPEDAKPWPDMALSMQSDHYFAMYTIWEDEKDDERCKQWTWDIMKDIEKESVGSYLGDADFRYRRTKFWGDDEAKRLAEVRRKWDPEGRMCGYLELDDGVTNGDGRRDVGRTISNLCSWEEGI